MPSKVLSAAIVGLDAKIIEIETDASYGLRHFEKARNHPKKVVFGYKIGTLTP